MDFTWDLRQHRCREPAFSVKSAPFYSTLPVYISDSYNDLKFGYAAAATMVGGAFIVGIMMLLEVVLNAGYRKKQGH